ncbi:hypothetical protein EI555_013766, partial [Monodon monoceros]
GLRPGSRKAGGAPRRGRNRGAAAPPAGAGRLCSRRSDSLRWNRPRSPPARSALPQPCFHPRSLPREAGLAVQNGRRLLAPTAISLTPLAPLPVGPRPRMPRYRFRQSPLIISCWYKKRRKSRVRAERRKRRFFNLKANFYFRLLKAEGHQERIQVFRMSLAGPGIAFSAHTPQTLGQVPVQEAGEERRAHREPLLVHLRRPRFSSLSPGCFVYLRIRDSWGKPTSIEQGTNKPTPVPVPSARKARSLVKRKTAPRSFAPFEREGQPGLGPLTTLFPQLLGLHAHLVSPRVMPKPYEPCKLHPALSRSGRCGCLGVGGSEGFELSPDPGSPDARRGRRRALGLQSGGSETPSRPQEALADALRVSQFSLGESRSWWPHRAAPDQALNLPRDLTGGVQPPGEAPEKQESRGRGTGETARVRWAESQDSECLLITLMC